MATTDCTKCIDGVLQLLQPDPPIVYTVPGGSGSPGIAEFGLFPLTAGVNEYFVGFLTEKISSDYSFVELSVENLVDPERLNLEPSVFGRTINGFNILLNGYPNTPNYRLRWSVIINTVA